MKNETNNPPSDVETVGTPAIESGPVTIIEPTLERDDLDSDGTVGVVAYPYQLFRGKVTVPRHLFSDRVKNYVVSVDQSRRLAVRADTYPRIETREIADFLKLPAEVPPDQCREMARESIFKWTLRTLSLRSSPAIEISDPSSVHKLFWIIERDRTDLLVDSVDGTKRKLKAV